MKFYAIAILFLSVLTACGSDQQGSAEPNVADEKALDSAYCDCTELTYDQPYNHFWRYEKRKGFTGKCEEFYANGQVKVTKNFTAGKLHGKFITYYDNGQIHEEKEFDKNVQVGEQLLYTKKGEVKFHALYNNGVQQQILVNRPDLLEEDPWDAN